MASLVSSRPTLVPLIKMFKYVILIPAIRLINDILVSVTAG